jgi:hypothetical protein
MDLHVNTQTQTRRPGAEPLTGVIEGGGLPWGPARPREYGAGVTSNAVARAIEDLRRSGYRPLHAHLAPPEPSWIPRARVTPGTRHVRRSSGSYQGRHTPVEEDVT